MNKYVNSISGRLSLRAPQRASLEILDRVTEIVALHKETDRKAALASLRSEFPIVTDFEREFPSVCFALATGVGKTRLMGAFISYLHLAHGINNFFVLAPNLTIYNKLITDFTPNTKKYVFTGIAEFTTEPPLIVTGDNYDQAHTTSNLFPVTVNIFNISKINSEVRGGKAPRIKRLSEYIGQSYYDYLAELKDLVLIMDESHRYRATAGIRAINDLKPVLGLELTATPFVETAKGPVSFSNVILDYPLGKAMADGYVKEPAVVTRKNFSPSGMSAEEIERLKLEDGIHLHESVKVELETYARETDNRIVKPFVLVIARDTTHAGQLLQLIQSDSFFEGRYKDKVIQVDSSKTGAEEDEMILRLLAVESTEEPTEIVIHVNMLKEGWDVTNLYTIVPLRAANARTLIEQSIGRGLRLPYGKRTGFTAVDRLNIVAHDKFQEIVDEASRPDSAIRLQQVVLSEEQLGEKTESVISRSTISNVLGIGRYQDGHIENDIKTSTSIPLAFKTQEEQKIAQYTYQVIQKLAKKSGLVPSSSSLLSPEIQNTILEEVKTMSMPLQMKLEGLTTQPDIVTITGKTSELIAKHTIDIPRILVVPKGEIKSGYHKFQLELSALNYSAPSEELWIQHLRTNVLETIGVGSGGMEESRLEDYIVSGLIDFDDICYDHHADLLYDLSAQAVKHFLSYLTEDDTRKVLRLYQREIARFIHSQMQSHYWEESAGYDVVVKQGFTELKDSAYSATAGARYDFHFAPSDKSNMAKYLFNGFKNCLYQEQKFHSDSERKLAVILDRETNKWFRPAKGQFQIFYKIGSEHLEYQPDFIAESDKFIYMLESKSRNEMDSIDVLAKRDAAVKWCINATQYTGSYGGKSWKYVLIPHDIIAENMTVDMLAKQFGCN